MKKLLSLLVVFFCFQQARSQVLMSLIFGDKLNSPNIEFGLDGGVNFSSISNLDSDYKRDFNLGFYFDFNHFYLRKTEWHSRDACPTINR